MTTNATDPKTIPAGLPQSYTYETAPARLLQLTDGVPISRRQLERWVERRKATMTKVGHRVYFTERQLQELADSLVVKAAR